MFIVKNESIIPDIIKFRDADVEALDVTLAGIIYVALGKFIEQKKDDLSYPKSYSCVEDWHNDLNIMRWCFYVISKEYHTHSLQYTLDIQIGINLFAKNFTNLFMPV